MTTKNDVKKSTSLQRIAKMEKVEDAWFEGDDGYWAILKKGWCWDGAHACHERTLKDLRIAINSARPCTCPDCK